MAVVSSRARERRLPPTRHALVHAGPGSVLRATPLSISGDLYEGAVLARRRAVSRWRKSCHPAALPSTPCAPAMWCRLYMVRPVKNVDISGSFAQPLKESGILKSRRCTPAPVDGGRGARGGARACPRGHVRRSPRPQGGPTGARERHTRNSRFAPPEHPDRPLSERRSNRLVHPPLIPAMLWNERGRGATCGARHAERARERVRFVSSRCGERARGPHGVPRASRAPRLRARRARDGLSANLTEPS